ncbi:hypothetical protein N657DRAFT_645324 [Parathielavia appendiculata]|uniref:Uncharacterized protein n=1 Tax=Parathielavia appendiculata TaxID=2587402 RepID=A0AAN6U1V8_9PEZI|nr:hypothetical protein N657DRAFT_645324 [Parathielavia appendiculata]
MAPIPVYTNSPINAAKASAVALQTAAEDKPAADGSSTPAYITAPLNHPQASWTPTPTRTIPFQQGPAAPQPGAIPRLPEATTTTSSSSSLPPPPPQAGAGPGATGPAAPAPTAPPLANPHIPGMTYPPQMAIPPPQGPGYGQQGTSTATAPPVTGPSSVEGPGGYRQITSGFTTRYDSGSRGYGDHNEEEGDGAGGFLQSAVKLAKAAGEKLSAAESEVWRRINEGTS